MKKFVAVLLVLMLVTFAGVGRVQGVVGEVFCQVPLSVFSRSPADSFIIPIMAINKGTSDMRIQKIGVILQDGTRVLEETLGKTLAPASLQGLTDQEIRNRIGIVQPDEKSLATAQALIAKAATMGAGDERTRAVETAWLLLSTNITKVEAVAAEKLLSQARSFSVTIPLDRFPKKIELSEVIPVRLDITMQDLDGSVSTISQATNLFYLTSLPSQWGWYPGDGHLHSTWSDGDSTIASVAATASNRGLQWSIMTDHAGDSVQSPSQPRLESSEWTSYGSDCTTVQSNRGITVCPGEELTTKEKPLIGAGGSHLLTYKNSSYAASYGLAPQTLINRAINAGGFGIIAHPYNSSFNWSDWYNGSYTGFRGIELISNNTIVNATQIGDWDGYLRSHLSATMQDPNHRFCVGLAGSDFHTTWVDDYLGANMNYIYTGSSVPPGSSRTSVYSALESGRVCASSDGSLLVHKITTGGVYLPGYYVQKSAAGNITVNVYAAYFMSMPVGGWAKVEIVTSAGTIVTDYVVSQTVVNKDYSIYVSGDTYVRVQVTFFDGSTRFSSCFTNPTFIDFAPYNQ
ncbi:MAG: CehA/McbA family metallohydrolase [Candidatus Cryosericum sp.]